MKTALWMMDGVTQAVLSHETEWERTALKQLQSGRLVVMNGEFYECRGGYWRGVEAGMPSHGTQTDTILRVYPDKPEAP